MNTSDKNLEWWSQGARVDTSGARVHRRRQKCDASQGNAYLNVTLGSSSSDFFFLVLSNSPEKQTRTIQLALNSALAGASAL